MRPEERDFAAQLLPHRRLLYARAMRLEASPDGADDLVQETIERALRASDRFKPGTNLKGWLLTIMTNLSIDHHRRASRETLVENQKLAVLASAPEPHQPMAWEAITASELRDAVAQLQPDLRCIVTLYLDGLCSYQQLGQRLGLPTNTVGTRLFRARRTIGILLRDRIPAIAEAPATPALGNRDNVQAFRCRA
jgi:RNA polymerase sigma-70 factor (ECF subfamily)